MTTSPLPEPPLVTGAAPGQTILGGSIPEITWRNGDDLCDCTFQRIGEWTNPYIARTMRVRFCCLWAEIARQYPQFVQEIPAYYDGNADAFVTKPQAWDAEDADMPMHLWHRQVAVQLGIPVGAARRMLKGQEPPRAVPGSGVRLAGAKAEGSHRKGRRAV